MSFDNFVQIAVTVKSLTDAFMRIDKEGRGYATIGYEQVGTILHFIPLWLQLSLFVVDLLTWFCHFYPTLPIVLGARCYQPVDAFPIENRRSKVG